MVLSACGGEGAGGKAEGGGCIDKRGKCDELRGDGEGVVLSREDGGIGGLRRERRRGRGRSYEDLVRSKIQMLAATKPGY